MKLNKMIFAAALLAGITSASAAPRLIFDASASQPDSIKVSAPELAALKRLYAQKGIKVCGDFSVRLRQSGQFTAHRTQTLYLVENCYDDYAAHMMRQRWRSDLLILDGTRLNYLKTAFTDDVTVLPSVNGSGLNALLTQIWYGPHMGEFGSVGEIKAFKSGGFNTLLKLGDVYRDIDTEKPVAMRRAIWFDRAQPNLLRVAEYTSPACDVCKNPPYDPARAKQTLRVTVDLRRAPTNDSWQR